MNKETITKNVKDFLNERAEIALESYDKNDYVNKWIDLWYENKKDIIEIFEKHPNYNGNGQIIFDEEFTRSDIEGVIGDFLYDYLRKTYSIRTDENYAMIRDTINILHNRNFVEPLPIYVPEDLCEYLKSRDHNIKVHRGEKLSRFVYRVMSKGFSNDENFERDFARFSDALNPMTYKEHVVISVNPIDYLSMSLGNSWTSCQTIGDENSEKGLYSSGALSYMLDAPSFIVYTLPISSDTSRPELKKKISRQIFFYGGDYLISSRLYPKHRDEAIKEKIFNIVKSVFDTNYIKDDNLNDFVFEKNWFKSHISSSGTQYPDYNDAAYRKIVYVPNHKEYKKILIGHDPICPGCGKEHRRERSIMCYKCTSDNYGFCDNCGAEIDLDSDDVVFENGYVYCNDECAES